VSLDQFTASSGARSVSEAFANLRERRPALQREIAPDRARARPRHPRTRRARVEVMRVVEATAELPAVHDLARPTQVRAVVVIERRCAADEEQAERGQTRDPRMA